MGSEKTEISARFEPRGRYEAKRAAPGPDGRVLSRSWQPGATLSGGQPLHQEPEHGLVRAGAAKAHRDGSGISGDHRADLEQPKA